MTTRTVDLSLSGRALACPVHIFVHFTSSRLEKITLAKGEQAALFYLGQHEKEPLVTQWFKGFFSGMDAPFPLPLNRGKISPFTWRVLEELQNIPHGKTASYSDVAASVGNEKAARAVGNACRVNPFPIVIPCHRVVKGDGTLGGFAYGPNMKENLLNIERLETL